MIIIYLFLFICDTNDFYRIVDNSVFNNIIKIFLKMPIDNVNIDEQSREKVVN